MGVCAGSQARRRAHRAEIALKVRGDAFLFCGDAFLALLGFLALFGCLDLFGYRAAHNNYCQQCHGAGFPH
jgi:hypothetical protein